MSDIHSRTVHKNPCAWHVTHWQSTAEVRETGSSQRESKKAAGEQEQNAGYTDAGDGFMNIPDGVDEQLPFA